MGGRLRVLRSALAWAWNERILPLHPLRGMRGPGRPAPRRPLPDAAVGALLIAAEMRLLEAHANHRDGHGDQPRVALSAIVLQRAEQDLLLVRLAADSGARRGELAALQIGDLDGRVLHIDRAISAGVLTTPKSGQGRSLTLGTHTADLWHQLAETWTHRDRDEAHSEGLGGLGPWLFAADSAIIVASAPRSSATGSPGSGTRPVSPAQPCTASGIPSPPHSSATGRSSTPTPASARRRRHHPARILLRHPRHRHRCR
ncbi:hypothetical protein QI633_25185 [Nocardioides sp. QY071]|uniref:hypothetical protein n=1 Tax=Nocardioides sp. QY071 TaxID=3044187 RepID=UPI002499FAB0|nr:hypothetical protein [Nocardioides sp. QY071]WGY04860.1 hypothetical protein QI633_25185 [Nocardioides sp. QY071]